MVTEDPGTSDAGGRWAASMKLSKADRRLWPTWDGLASDDFTLSGESRVAVASDWESQTVTVLALIRHLTTIAPDVRTVLHLGDLRFAGPRRIGGTGRLTYPEGNFIPRLDAALALSGIDRLLLTPGNHEDWQLLHDRFALSSGRPLRVAPRIWVLPRGCRFRLRTMTFLSFGGAVSVDRDRGPLEAPTDEDVRRACAAGQVDVLLTHEPPLTGVPEVESRIRDGASAWSPALLRRSSASRERVERVRAATAPTLVVHGHMHVHGRHVHASGSTTVALGAAVSRAAAVMSVGVLDLRSGAFAFLDEMSAR